MKPQSELCHINFRMSRLFGLLLLFCLPILHVFGQRAETGAVSGVVTNAATLIRLEGANVRVVGTNLTALTDREGRFYFSQIPAGQVELRVDYAGLNTETIRIEVAAGAAVSMTIALNSEVYQLDQFVVSGVREGDALAIQQQRVAPNVKNVLSTDAFGSIADGNLGNFIKRIPGVAIQYGEGEVQGLKVRGIDPDRNAVTIDGNRMATGKAGFSTVDRGFSIDTAPSDAISKIEVIKSPTPDMDADSLGGAINMVSRTALDRGTRHTSYSLGTVFNSLRDNTQYRHQFNFSHSDVFGADKNLGVSLSIGSRRSQNPKDRIFADYVGIPPGGGSAPWTGNPDDVRINQITLGDDFMERTRDNAALRLDYRLSDRSKFHVNTIYSHTTTQLRRFEVRALAANRVVFAESEPGRSITANHNFSNSNGMEERWVKSYYVALGGDHRLGNWTIDYSASYADSPAGNHSRGMSGIVAGTGWSMDQRDDHQYPVLTQVSGPDANDFENMTANFNTRKNVGGDSITGAQVNIKRDFAWTNPASIKFGARYRGQERTRITKGARSYDLVGPDGRAGRHPTTGINDDNLFELFGNHDYGLGTSDDEGIISGRYQAFRWLDVVKTFSQVGRWAGSYDFIPDGPLASTYFRENIAGGVGAQQDEAVKEEISSAYLMVDKKIGKLGILGGVRVERTDVNGTGLARRSGVSPQMISDPSAPGGLRLETPAEALQRAKDRLARIAVETPAERPVRLAEEAAQAALEGPEQLRARLLGEFDRVDASSGYTNVFPGLHLRYEVRPGLIARASWSTSIGRPNFGNIFPRGTVNIQSEVVSVNNTGIKPQTADNYDLSLEYYFEPVGVLSVGVFRKDLNDFIFNDVKIIPNGIGNGFNGLYEGWELRQASNGRAAKVEGLEINYSQQFSFLPGPLQNLSGFANFTKLRSEGDFGNGSSQLPGFTPETINLGLNYDIGKFDVRALWNYQGTRLKTFNVDPNRSQWNIAQGFYDLSLTYKHSRRLNFYLDVVNVFNSPEGDYYGSNTNLVRVFDWYGRRVSVGVRGSF